MDKWDVVIPAIATVIGALLVYLGNYLTSKSRSRRDEAEANAVDVKTLRDLASDVRDLSEKVNKIEAKNTILWQYVYALLDHIREKGGVPPLPPVELETDPKLMKIISEIKGRSLG